VTNVGLQELQNSVQNFPDSWGKQRQKVSTQDHAIIRPLRWRIWGVGENYRDRRPQRLHELLPWNWKMQQNMAPSAA
jgi:hypothetical protein